MSNKKRLLYKGQHIALYIDDVSTSDVIFTFSGHGANPKDLYGDGFIQSLGFSGVFFVALANHWWQTEELSEAINIANSNTYTHTNRIAYGQSMGGYGALLCAAKLKSRVVVTAPQTTLNSQHAKIPQSWMKDISKYPTIRDNIVNELINIESIKIIYDIKDKCDVSHVNYLKAHIEWIDEYTVPYATHNLPKTLREMGIISNIVSDAFKNEINDKIEFRKKINNNRKKSISYLLNLGTSINKSRNRWLYYIYKDIVSSYFEDLISQSNSNSFLTNKNYLDDFKTRFISMNQHVESYDTNKLLFLSKGNDPQFFIGNLPDGNKVCSLSFFSNTKSFGNVFFLRASSTAYTPKDAISFSVVPGINHIRFTLPGSYEDGLQQIRIDPISCTGFFQILDFIFE
ncbi:hypothetical protein OB931_04055 [Aeromonas media]|uniref:hypothetical protein n=1 Tax=Aeromonas media TaxID=651 RepID=UPI0024C20105|nr:hypothetical protein [Aeromonas media]MDM5075561.1 hypothetical protein [Aeromonas media]